MRLMETEEGEIDAVTVEEGESDGVTTEEGETDGVTAKVRVMGLLQR